MYIQEAHLQMNHAVEIIGKVQNDLSVKVMASTDFGPENGIGELFMMYYMTKSNAVQTSVL
jgi:hypothetical protein